MPRARRIRNEEWEIWRETLTRLYLDNGTSRKDILDTMAKEHNFTINEKQLKHRLKKWGVKKYIPHDDMTKMISFQRNRRAAGFQVTFEYRGHAVEEERLERAAKQRRLSPLPDTVTLPPYIATLFVPIEPQTERVAGATSSENAGCDEKGFSMSESDTQMGSTRDQSHDPCSDFRVAHRLEPTEGIEEVQRVDMIGMAHSQDLAFSWPSPGWGSIDWSTTPCQERFDQNDTVREATSVIDQPKLLGKLLGETLHPYDIEWSAFLQSPLGIQASLPGARSRNTPSPSKELGPSRSSTRIPTEDSFGEDTLGREDLVQTQVASCDLDVPQGTYKGEDMNAILLPIQSLHLQFEAYLKYSSTNRSDFGDHTRRDFLDAVEGNWIRHEVEDLLCCVYEDVARTIRKRQGARLELLASPYRDHPSVPTLQDEEPILRAMDGSVTPYHVGTVLKSNLLIETPTGRLRIHLRTPSAAQSPIKGLETLGLSFMPIAHVRTNGITASFQRDTGSNPACQISRSIRTFNVVPQDSAIVQCVSRNDLAGVQALFDRREASPLDVDPCGFSLLSYALKSGGSDVFLLLLGGGASTQTCDHYGSTLDIVWSLWFQYLDNVGHARLSSSCIIPFNGDVDQCIRITDAVMEQGHDMEESVCYNSDRANVLFEMNDCLFSDILNSQNVSGVLDYLINKGFDIEKRNYLGLTPLLHAVRSYRPQALDCVKTFIRRGANTRARSKGEQSALHIALAGPHQLLDWKRMRYMRSAGDRVVAHYWTLQILYQTDIETHGPFNGPCDRVDGMNWRSKYLVNACGSPQRDSRWTYPDERLCNEIDSVDVPSEQDGYRNQGEDAILTDEFPEYIFCKNYDGFEHLIRHPMKVLKTRLRLLLLTLLQAGCDPNIIDGDNETPSIHARRNELWPQWSWALKSSGYTYEVRDDRWVKAALPDLHPTVE